MNGHVRIILLGSLSLIISVPIWYTIISSEEFSPDVFLDPSLLFWLIFGFVVFLFGYYNTDVE
ncbi:hypothetical protein C473_16157 [Halorubrum distributum JCM 10247]|uniref:Uncharacterized protein n=1 Tax=Halorubrum distributum JCM 10247 TaxID=1227486 RepID=M0CXG1_9EURY|nr:hypothetical protein C473_16157 [Halorubrum terrestre JCM 10247]